MKNIFISVTWLLLLSLNAVSQAPVITSFTPISGPVGTLVTITGTNFSTPPSNNIVYFGAAKATVSASTSSSISVVVPFGATYQSISVTNNSLIAFSKIPFNIISPAGGMNFTNTSFSTAANYGGGGFVTEGDLDGDGKIDLVYTRFSTNIVTIYRNTSTGGTVSFAATTLNGMVNPICVNTADLNGDGMLDLIVANSSFNVVYVLKNNSTPGTISFATAQNFATGAEPRKIATGDIDKDGKVDIVTSNQSANSISVLRNTSTPGAISFAANIEFSTPSKPEGVAVGHLNSDDKPDIMVACNGSHVLSVFKNNSIPGSIILGAVANYSTGAYPWDVTAADVDGDGKLDVISTNTSPNTISVFRNTSTTGLTLAAKVDFSTSSSPRGISINDLNCDGKPDVVTANYFSNSQISVLKNTSAPGTFSFAPFINYTTNTGTVNVVLADLDQDGLADITTANSNSNSLSYFKNKLLISTLPVNMLSFTAGEQNNAILLNWVVTNEVNNLLFEVEHSTEGITFKKIGIVNAVSNNGVENNYRFLHNNPALVNYYRLKQVDTDGEFTLSKIILMRKTVTTVISIISDPSKSFISIVVNEPGHMLTINDATGRFIKKVFITSGKTDISIQNLPNGTYNCLYGNNIKRFVKVN